MTNNNKYSNGIFIKSLGIFALVGLLSTPLILNGIFSGNLDDSWIGFWGSFAGGILGTLGVIFVAYLQSNEHRELTKEQNDQQIIRLHEA